MPVDPEVRLRPATLDDLEFIWQQLLAGARLRHFDYRLLQPEQNAEIRADLTSIIRDGCRAHAGLAARALVFEKDSQSIGHAILTAILNTEGIELYALALDPKQRGRGLGSAMLDRLLDEISASGTIYARCFPASTVMYEMLLNRGFEYIMTMRSGARVLRREPKRPAPTRISR